MPRFAANLSMMFNEVPMLDRFERAARAGFEAVEMLFPHVHPAAELRHRLDANGLALVLHNLPPGDYDAGERGLACLPDRADEFRESVAIALSYAQALGTPQLHVMAGKRPTGVGDATDEAVLHATYVENLGYAAAQARRVGIRLLIEPINRFDMPGYYLTGSAQAAAVIDEVGADNLFMQYDIYHAQRSEGELIATMQTHLARIAHMQIADNPGRHEPGSGEIHFDNVFAAIDAMGYTGWIGCEYVPANGTEAGLGWLERARADAKRRAA